MARGVRKKDFDYEVDITATDGTVSVGARMLVSMDFYNVGAAETKIKETTSTVVKIAAHITLNKNEKEFGIHARYAYCEFSGAIDASKCYGITPKRFVEIPILTLAQFATLNPYDFEAGGTQANTTLIVNHSFDGTEQLTYRIRKLVNQVSI